MNNNSNNDNSKDDVSGRLPRWLSGKEPACQCRRCGFDPWVREDPLEEFGNLSSILPWKIPWVEESGGLKSIGSERVGQD